MLKFIHFVQNLSLDITAGAAVMTLFIAKVYQVSISSYAILGLSIAIWLIYTVDHLLDAQRAKQELLNPRHAFHLKYNKWIIVLATLIFLVGLWNLQNLPIKTLLYGMALVVLSAVYLLNIYKKKKLFQKEIFAAFVYTAGVATAPLSQLDSLNGLDVLLLVQIFLLAYSNLLIIPLYEYQMDREDQHSSIVTIQGTASVIRRVNILCVLCLLLIIMIYVLESSAELSLILASMTCVLYVLLHQQVFFRRYQLYRVLADGIFFIPVIYLLT